MRRTPATSRLQISALTAAHRFSGDFRDTLQSHFGAVTGVIDDHHDVPGIKWFHYRM
ncbi:MAG: hypothetical protein L0J73_12930 [Halomonas sp.]|nr:hypothetical protein [Halomonas sp.]